MAEDEWMYELKNAEDADPNAALNEAWALFVAGNVTEAKAVLARAAGGPSHRRLRTLLEPAARSDAAYCATIPFAY